MIPQGCLCDRACLQVTIAYVDLGRPRPERRAALLESYHFDINGQARAACPMHPTGLFDWQIQKN